MTHALTATVFLAVISVQVSVASADDKPTKARMVFYTGKVQGVGFRATTVELARDYPVTGWVKNLADGRVQLLVEGPEESVDKFLKAIRTRWKENIDKEEIKKQDATGKYKSFDVAK